MTALSGPFAEPPPDVLLTVEAAGKWGAWRFAMQAQDTRSQTITSGAGEATKHLLRAMNAGAVRVWRGDGVAPALVSLAEAARWQDGEPGKVFDMQTARMVLLPGPLRVRWGEAFAALATEFHPRAAPLSREDAATLAQQADDWLHPADALNRVQPVLAPLVPSWKVQRCLGVLAIGLNLVPVAERLGEGSVRPIVLEPGQAWDLPAIGSFLFQEWQVLADSKTSVVRAAPWRMETDGPVPVPRHLWQQPNARPLDHLVPAPRWSPIALHVPRLLAALRALASDRTRCHARGITPPEIVEPLPVAQRWTPVYTVIADAGGSAHRMAIGAAIMAGALPVALRLPQRASHGVPPEDVQVPPALLPCLTLAESVETGSFDWARAVAIADADPAGADTRAAVVRMAPCRRGRDDATRWELVGLALRPGELVAALQAGKGIKPKAAESAKKSGAAGPRMSRAVQQAREALHTKLAAEGAPDAADAPAELVRWFIERLEPEARGSSEANAKRHVADVVKRYRAALAPGSQHQTKATGRAKPK
jgi:hypothetical protein